MEQDSFAPAAFPVHDGMQIENYKIVEKLGTGGMGVVFKAHDLRLKRLVAIKFMQHLGEGSQGKQRFSREAEISASLSHPHIIKVYDVGSLNKIPYFVMEYVEGAPLHKYLATNILPINGKLALLHKVALALHYAHEQKIVHRDIKPSNIMVRANGEPVLMDFGLAKTSKVNDYTLTRTGEVVGTPEYMAPEQARGIKRAIDAQTDVYGLGAVMYQMLTGVPPVAGENLLEKVYQVVEKRPRPLRSYCPEIPSAVEEICLKALEKRKEDRHASAAAFAADIEAFLRGEATVSARFYARRAARRWILASVGILLLSVLATVAWYLLTRPQAKTPPKLVSGYWLEVERHHTVGMEKLKYAPQEAYIYLQRADALLAQVKTQLLDRQALARLADIRKSLPASMVIAAVGAGKYQHAYELGSAIMANGGDIVVAWHVACAAYHCGFLEEAAERFARIQENLAGQMHSLSDKPAEAKRYQVQTCYYRGLVCFQQNLFAKAREFWQEVLPAVQGNNDDLTISLYLHYCALLLADIEQTMGEQEFQSIGDYLQAVDKKCENGRENPFFARTFHWETKARYLLKMAERKKDPAATGQAQEVVQLIQRCLDTSQVKGSWHYIRARARLLLGDLAGADSDLDIVSDLDPSLGGAIIAKSELMLQNPHPNEVQAYSLLLPGYLFRGFRQPVVAVPQEFARLQRQHASQSTTAHGLPFSHEVFDEYYKKLSDVSPEIRQVAKTALAAMVPYASTKAALKEVSASLKTDEAKNIAEVMQEIEAQERQQARREFMAALCGVPFYGKIFEIGRFYPRYLELLKEMLQQGDNVFLRFLAAKAMVQIPVLETRKYLWQRYISGQPDARQKEDLMLRVIVAYAFQEIGYLPDMDARLAGVLWETCRNTTGSLFDRRPPEEEFVQSLLTQILRARAHVSVQLLGWLLENGSDKVKIAAASRFAWPYALKQNFPAIYNQLLQCLQRSVASRQTELQTAAFAALSDFLDSPDIITQYEWGEIATDHFVSLQLAQDFCDSIGQAPPQLCRAMLYFWRKISKVPKLAQQEKMIEEICKAMRPLWKNADPLIRYQVILTSAELWDKEVYLQIGFCENALLMERLPALFGGFGSATLATQRSGPLWWIGQFEKRDFLNDANWRVPVMLLYIMGREGKGILSRKIFEALSHKNPRVRFAAIISSGFIGKLPAKRIEQLQKLAETDAAHYVRFAALGVIINHFYREKPELLARYHRLAKEYRGEYWQDCRAAAAWGYSLPWEGQLSFSVRMGRQFGELKQNWDYACSEFIKNSRNQQVRSEYIDRLRRGMELLADLDNRQLYHDFAYFLALLYEKEGKDAEAIAMLTPIVEQFGHQDLRCACLWSKFMVRQKRGEEARTRIEYLLAGIGGSQCRDWLDWHQRSLRESQWKRGLGQILQLDAATQPQAEMCMQEQFLLAPHLIASLETMGEYYYANQDLTRATYFFEVMQDRLPRYGETYLWLARMAMREKDLDKAVFFLRQATLLSYLMSREELLAYPELAPLADNEAVRQILPKD